MMNRLIRGGILGALVASTCVLPGAVRAQPAVGERVAQDFENNEGGWVGFGDGAKVAVTRDAEGVHGGNAALQFDYTLAPRQINAIVLADTGPLATLGAGGKISFWAKAREAGTMAFAVQEKGGPVWMSLFRVPEGEWQRVELSPRDFGLAPDQKPDADGVLSLDNLEWAGIGDFAQFLLGDPKSPLIPLFGLTTGARTLWLDDISFEPGAAPAAEAGAPMPVDDFVAPQIAWLPLAGVDVRREEREVEGADGAGGAKAKRFGLALSYTQAAGKIGGVVRRFDPKRLAGAQKISLDLASDSAADLVLQLEEVGGGKYNVTVKAAGDGTPRTMSWSKAQFTPADDSRDGNGTLDMDQVQQIILLDAAFLNPAAPNAENTVWIGNIQAHK
jgi:hypothetical protein